MSLPEIAIIGSGLSGLSLALHLARRDIKATVYEFRPANYSQGGDIALGPNAARVLDHLGIFSTLQKNGFNSDTVTMLNKSGQVLGVIQQGSFYGYSAIRLKRTVLREALLEECDVRGVEIIYDKKFVRLEERDGKVKVEFEDGSVVSADLVVGANGLRSSVRPFINDKVKPTYNGTMLIYGTVPAPAMEAGVKAKDQKLPMPSMTLGKEGSFTIWPRDHDAQEVGFFANLLVPDRSREEWEKIENDKEGLRKMLEECFCQGGWPAQIEVMIREAAPEEFRIWATNMVPPLPEWSSPSGKVILVGDAAHAMSPASGQGGAMSFEDGETLAYAIQKSLTDETWLQKWETHRQVRVQQTMDFNNLTAKFREPSQFALLQWVREGVLWGILKIKGPEGYRWLYGYDGEVEMAKL